MSGDLAFSGLTREPQLISAATLVALRPASSCGGKFTKRKGCLPSALVAKSGTHVAILVEVGRMNWPTTIGQIQTTLYSVFFQVFGNGAEPMEFSVVMEVARLRVD